MWPSGSVMLYIFSCLALAQKGRWDCTGERLTWPLDGWGSVGLSKSLHPALNLQGVTFRLTKKSPLFVFGQIIKLQFYTHQIWQFQMMAFSCTRTISTSVCNSNLIISLDNCRLELWKGLTFFSLLLRRKWKPEGSTWWRFCWWDHLQLSLLALITAYKFRHKELFSLNSIQQTKLFFHPAAAMTQKGC